MSSWYFRSVAQGVVDRLGVEFERSRVIRASAQSMVSATPGSLNRSRAAQLLDEADDLLRQALGRRRAP